MKRHSFIISHWDQWLMMFLVSIASCLIPGRSQAHPMPNSVVLLRVHANHISAELQIPLSELQAAIGMSVNDSSAGLIERLGQPLRAYLIKHIRPKTIDGKPWHITVGALKVHETQNAINGVYRELTAQLELTPPKGADVRQFIFDYDAVLHQVVTHKILVSVGQDWETGKLSEESPSQVGVIELDIVNNRILPLTISLEPGNMWKGFVSMVRLGIQHIAEGTDHLLFLLVLLLPAPLLYTRKRWTKFGGIRYSMSRLLWIVTAFTVGHSITLLLGAFGWVRLPSQYIEIFIALSILVSAMHAIRPIFPGKETWIAAGFGLIHGLAFANTLANLSLDAGRMALSILGFNVGIELMQLLIILVTIPWLILPSRTPAYRFVRLTGAFLAALAAIAWTVERVTGNANAWAGMVEHVAGYAPYILLILALTALFFTWRIRQTKNTDVI
ncbi:HupE/UreJ family protein [Dyadobacter sp. CY356]|uniref:HupE/UreJ family protein n=1 Tax=Dyadobacter sp. CY356 TaxID=2906442 RepID=UPI00286E4237|nr:HupE/UreJ family protein [Dyadobacter sp. CY356]